MGLGLALVKSITALHGGTAAVESAAGKGTRVRLTALDRGKIGMPLVGGLALTLYNLLGDLVQALQNLLLSPSAAWGLAAAGLGYGYKSFYGYQQTKQRYHLTLTQSLYFQNLDSNAGVLTRLRDEAEEQECRTAILAYFCLWRYGKAGWTAEDLDAQACLRAAFDPDGRMNPRKVLPDGARCGDHAAAALGRDGVLPEGTWI